MISEEHPTEPQASQQTRCRHLLNKGLFINHGLPVGEEATGDGHFWCGMTQAKLGPDKQSCNREDCLDCNRDCYEE
jgi:hypothetical protein